MNETPPTMTGRNRTRILLVKPGLDGHDVGAKIVVRALMEAGFEVTYTGLKKTPEEIVRRVIEERPDVLGLSILSGAHVPVCRRIADLLRAHALPDLIWIVGGNIPDPDHAALQGLGVDAVFAVGSSTDEIVDFIRGHVASGKRAHQDETVA